MAIGRTELYHMEAQRGSGQVRGEVEAKAEVEARTRH